MSKLTLVIGDAHVEAGEDLRRFEALGNFIIESQPDNIISIGDFLSLDALSAWDLNKSAKMEGRRLKKELEAGKEAIELIESPTLKYNKRQKRNKKRGYTPNKYYINGNHEFRLDGYLETKPELTDMVDPMEYIGIYKYGWETVPYREYIHINGIQFTHVPMNGANQPMGKSQNYLHVAAKEHNKPIVWGHSHALGLQTFTHKGEEEKQVMAINCGCFFEDVPEYARGSAGARDWWRGLVILEHYEDDTFDVHTKRLDALLREYL